MGGRIIVTSKGRTYEYQKEHFNLLLSTEEKNRLKSAADKMGLSMTQFLRAMMKAILEENAPTIQYIHDVLKDLSDTVKEKEGK